MNTQWDDVINELCLLEGMELMVDSSFDECHGHFTAVLKGVNEGKKWFICGRSVSRTQMQS